MKRSLLTALFLLFVSVLLQAQSLAIHHINVGQGDATLFVSPTGKTLLIDAGDNNKGSSKVLPYLQTLGITRLDYVIATHYHADHIGGLDEVLNSVGGTNVGTVYDRGTTHTVPGTAVYNAYANAAGAALGGRQALSTGTLIDLGGGVTLKCLATDGNVFGYGPVSKATSSENDLSSAWLVTFNEFKYFTGGDCGGESSAYADLETPIALSSSIGQVDAFKVNHHGSAYSSNQTFLDTLKASAAMILVGDGNSYLHPVQDVLNRIAAGNCYLYLTETGNGGTLPTGKGVVANGNILLTTTGHNTFSVSYGTHTDSYALHTLPQHNIAVTVSPTTLSLNTGGAKQFNATVTGGTTNTCTWSCTGGTVSATGLYTAPGIAGNYTVKVTSTEDPSKSASASVTVTAAPVVTVTISPSTVSIPSNATQQFAATVTNVSNTAVTWSCSGGVISTSGLYTAPATAGTYTVKATSVGDTTKSATATVTVTDVSPS